MCANSCRTPTWIVHVSDDERIPYKTEETHDMVPTLLETPKDDSNIPPLPSAHGVVRLPIGEVLQVVKSLIWQKDVPVPWGIARRRHNSLGVRESFRSVSTRRKHGRIDLRGVGASQGARMSCTTTRLFGTLYELSNPGSDASAVRTTETETGISSVFEQLCEDPIQVL